MQYTAVVNLLEYVGPITHFDTMYTGMNVFLLKMTEIDKWKEFSVIVKQ